MTTREEFGRGIGALQRRHRELMSRPDYWSNPDVQTEANKLHDDIATLDTAAARSIELPPGADDASPEQLAEWSADKRAEAEALMKTDAYESGDAETKDKVSELWSANVQLDQIKAS